MVNCTIEGDELVIRIPVSKAAVEQAPPSATGKTRLVGSTRGSMKVGVAHGHELSLSLNLTRKS